MCIILTFTSSIVILSNVGAFTHKCCAFRLPAVHSELEVGSGPGSDAELFSPLSLGLSKP